MRNYIDIVESKNEQFQLYMAPEDTSGANDKSVFLAGSIDMGDAVDWQAEVTKALEDMPVSVFNPRRDDWDSSWKQDISDDKFREQVEWEMDNLDNASVVCVYFDPNGKAPITLMELGLQASSGKVVVCCPEGYWRRGNVQIVCNRYNIPMVDTLDDLIAELKERLS